MAISTERAPRVLDLPAGPAAVDVLRKALEPLVAGVTQTPDGRREAVVAEFAPIAPIPMASQRVSEEHHALLRAAVRPQDPCPAGCDVILTTSGSTGEPKAVMHSWSAIAHSATALHERLGGSGAWVCALPLHTSAGFMTVARATVAGTVAIGVESLNGATSFTSTGFARAIAQIPSGRIYTSLVPAMASRLLSDETGVAALRRCDAVLIGGQAIPEPLIFALREAGVNAVLSYGMTETCGGCVYDGVPLTEVDVSIVGGRVQICGPVVMLGYRTDTPAERSQSEHCFLTSDRGEITAEGRLVVRGRIDDIVIVQGVNISLSAVEAILRDLGINGIACATQTMIYAATASALSPDEQQAAAARVSTELALRIDFRVVPDLPMTAAGKPDRVALAEWIVNTS